jgi:glutathione peroxidase
MYKYIIMGILSFLFASKELDAQFKSVYDFKVESLDGGTIDLSKYKGKKILIVNTASKCGFTPQYKGLEELYEKNKGKLVIIGFPSNNFLFQEPGKNADIKSKSCFLIFLSSSIF